MSREPREFHIHTIASMIGPSGALCQLDDPLKDTTAEGDRESMTFFDDEPSDTSHALRLRDGKVWVRVVPQPYPCSFMERVRAALAVISGSAHAVRWPQPGDLEKVLYHTRTT